MLKMLRAVIFIVVFATVRGDECVQRWFGEGRMVCVCNSTYCDDVVDEAPMLGEQQFQTYVSTKSGERLQFSTEIFSVKSDSDIVLTVDSTQQYQSIFGFGGAMTDATALNIRTLSNETQQRLIESYFASDGIGYTYVRIPIAGTDFSTRPYTYDDVPGDTTLSNFSLVEEDDYKIGYLHRIKDIMSNPDDLRIFTTSWSAPAWMKNSNNIKWGWLEFKYYELYANYTLKFFDAYKQRGIDIWGMTPGNEPINGAWPFFPFNAMLWTPSKEALWSTNYLAPTLSKAGYNLVYMIMDDQRLLLPWYEDIFNNTEAKKLFSGTAVHWYTDTVASPTILLDMHEKYPDKFILMTEACMGSNPMEKEKVILGSWERGERYINDIIQNLSYWVVGWIDWNMALNETGGPNWAKNFVDSPIIVNATSDEFYKQPMFYALAHFSKFVPRESRRIDSFGIDNKDINTISFLRPDKKVVTIIVNNSDKPYNITVKDKNEKNEKNKNMNLYIPQRSFTTLLYQSSQ